MSTRKATLTITTRARRFGGGLLALLLGAGILFLFLLMAAAYGDAVHGDWRCGMPRVECRIWSIPARVESGDRSSSAGDYRIE